MYFSQSGLVLYFHFLIRVVFVGWKAGTTAQAKFLFSRKCTWLKVPFTFYNSADTYFQAWKICQPKQTHTSTLPMKPYFLHYGIKIIGYINTDTIQSIWRKNRKKYIGSGSFSLMCCVGVFSSLHSHHPSESSSW